MRITDRYLAQFSAFQAAAILSGFSAQGYALRYSVNEACWFAETSRAEAKPTQCP